MRVEITRNDSNVVGQSFFVLKGVVSNADPGAITHI